MVDVSAICHHSSQFVCLFVCVCVFGCLLLDHRHPLTMRAFLFHSSTFKASLNFTDCFYSSCNFLTPFFSFVFAARTPIYLKLNRVTACVWTHRWHGGIASIKRKQKKKEIKQSNTHLQAHTHIDRYVPSPHTDLIHCLPSLNCSSVLALLTSNPQTGSWPLLWQRWAGRKLLAGSKVKRTAVKDRDELFSSVNVSFSYFWK